MGVVSGLLKANTVSSHSMPNTVDFLSMGPKSPSFLRLSDNSDGRIITAH